MRPPLSRAATGLLRQILARTDIPRDRILIGDFRSTDWYSLTYEGERHEISLRVRGHTPSEDAAALVRGIEEAELTLAGHIVADIAVASGPDRQPDGSVELRIEALTLVDA
ncbi:hypothetical protein WJT74_02335 [Sphingomicrobium sp. XHP0239]|uniref:hypothetical protein n=1 Tax=Sphingomicrobium maritimum TaxID=3133972 RepID=UPI0031CC3B77